MTAEEMASGVAQKTANGILEQGLMGSFVVLFFSIATVLLWVILRDKDYQKNLANALSDMVENQKNFNEQYRISQQHHREVVSLITEVTKQERENTKGCYEEVERKISLILAKIGTVA